jgi:hypothetical protein
MEAVHKKSTFTNAEIRQHLLVQRYEYLYAVNHSAKHHVTKNGAAPNVTVNQEQLRLQKGGLQCK